MSNLEPFLLVLTSFAVLLAIGCGAIVALRLPLSSRNIMSAPSIGVSVLTALGMTLGALGMHTNRFALALVTILAVFGGAAVVRFRASFSRSVPWPQLAVVVVAGLLVAMPSFRYGFSWVGFANQDITRTTMNARYWHDHGTKEIPRPSQLVWNQEIDGSEVGSEPPLQGGTAELMAILQVVTGLGPFESMMPSVLIAYMCAIAALGAMMPRRIGTRWACIAMACLAASPMFVYTTINQAVDELFGIAVICSYVALLPVLWRPRTSPAWYLLAGLLAAGLYELYLPLLIFAVLLTGAHVLLTVKLRRSSWFRIARRATIGALVSALLLNAYLVFVKLTIVAMFVSGTRPLRSSIRFTAFLLPPGVAYLWGLIPLWSYPAEPWMSLCIVAGIALTIAFVILAIRQARRRQAPALLSLLFGAFAVLFFVRRADYALFKIGSYLAPFSVYVMICGAAAFVAARNAGIVRRAVVWTTIVAVFALSMVTSAFYVRRSLDAPSDRTATFVLGRYLTTERIIERVGRAVTSSHAPVLVSDATQLNIQRFIAQAAPRKSVFFIANNEIENTQPSLYPPYVRWRPIASLRMIGAGPDARVAQFAVENRAFAPPMRCLERQYLMVGPRYDVFNRTAAWNADPFFSIVSDHDLTNGLAFVDSTLGSSEPGDPHVAFSVLEQDYFAPATTYAGVGRYLIFEVLHPTPNVRLLIDFTTVGIDAALPLPPVSVIGRRRHTFPLVGYGSARVLSPPLTPAFIHGHAYIAIDMGRDGTVRKYPRRGLFALFGREYDLDERKLVAYLRNLTATGDGRAANVEALRLIPGDLRSTGVRYSGLYDDGWSSQDSAVELTASGPGKRLRIAGMIPNIGDWPAKPLVTVKVDGRTIWTGVVHEGEFTISPTAAIAAGPHHVSVHFDQVQRLPDPDGRPIGALLQSLGFF